MQSRKQTFEPRHTVARSLCAALLDFVAIPSEPVVGNGYGRWLRRAVEPLLD